MNIVARVQSYACPSCGGYIGEAAPIAYVLDRSPSGQQRLILDLLARRIGKKVSRDAVISQLFEGRADGGPELADSVVSTQLSRLRKFVVTYGWTILTTGGGRGSPTFYSLVPTEAHP